MRLLITAGPTREYLDDVRFLSNASSGRMGYALAEAAARRGHDVILVSGPVALAPPEGVEYVSVETADEMLQACLTALPRADGVIGVAAVCDYRLANRQPGKIKKTGGPLRLDFVETPDVLAELARRKGGRWVLGFALETTEDRAAALEKLRSKHCDWIVLNRAEAIGSEATAIEVLDAAGRTVLDSRGAKTVVADRLVAWIESAAASR
jgi:phosphopantothenoylcysteine decarboxylase/phosphopantothenate--cysteine ligase